MNPGSCCPWLGSVQFFQHRSVDEDGPCTTLACCFYTENHGKKPTNLMVDDHVSNMFICFLFNVDHKFKIYQHTLFSDIQISYCWFYLQEMPMCPQISHWSTTLSGVWSWTIWQFGRHGAPEKLTGTCFHRGWCPGCVSRVWTPEMLAKKVCL